MMFSRCRSFSITTYRTSSRWTSTCAWCVVVEPPRTDSCCATAVTTAITSFVWFLPCTMSPKGTGGVPSASLRLATRTLIHIQWCWALGVQCFICAFIFIFRSMANLLWRLALNKPAETTPCRPSETWLTPSSLTILTCQFMWVCIGFILSQVLLSQFSSSAVFAH